MIFTRSRALTLALVLAGCGAAEAPTTPGDWRAELARGDAVAAERSLEKAIGEGAAPRELAPFLGQANLAQGDLAQARRWLATADFAPAVAARGFHMLGSLRLREGDLPAAGRAFDRALAAAPGGYDLAPELWVDIARLRYRGGEQAQAVEASLRALELGPDNPAALLLRAQLMRDAHGNAAALPLLERGLAAAPADPGLLADYAATLGELGRAKAMLAAVRQFSDAAPGDPRALYLQAVLAARAGRNDLARSLLQRSGNLERDMPAAILLLAVIDLENGNPASAAQGFDRVLRRQPDNQRVRALLALALAAGGNHRELVARFGTRVESRYLALLVGRAHEALGERDKAAPHLERAYAPASPARVAALPAGIPLDVAARQSDDPEAGVAAVRGLIAARRAGEARLRAARAVKRFPGSADVLALAGDAALAAGDAAGALRLYRRAAEIRRPWPLTKRIAAALERLGDLRGAEGIVAAHLVGEPQNAEAAGLLARRAAAAGDTGRARLLAAHAAAHGG